MKLSGEFMPVIPDAMSQTILTKQLANGACIRDYLTSSPGFDKQEVMDQIIRLVLQEVLLVPVPEKTNHQIPMVSDRTSTEDLGDQILALRADMTGRQFRTLLDQDLGEAIPENGIVREAMRSMLQQMHVQVVRQIKAQKIRHPTNTKPTFVSPHARKPVRPVQGRRP